MFKDDTQPTTGREDSHWVMEESCSRWTDRDVHNALNSIKNGMAPGIDLIEVEMAKRALKVGLLPVLVKLYNECLRFGISPEIWKIGSIKVLLKSPGKDPGEIISYRPVCLLPVFSKILEKLMRKSLKQIIIDPDFSSIRQFGFRESRGTEDTLVEVREMVSKSESKLVLAILFDISGAFDNIKWNTILSELLKRGCDLSLYRLVVSFFKDRKVYIVENYNRIGKQIFKGCPQGLILGPDFWNISLDEVLLLLEVLGASVTAYADDIVIIIEENSRRKLERKAQQLVDILNDWCVRQGLEISKTKTEMIVLKSFPKPRKTNRQSGSKARRKGVRSGFVTSSLVNVGKGGVRSQVLFVLAVRE